MFFRGGGIREVRRDKNSSGAITKCEVPSNQPKSIESTNRIPYRANIHALYIDLSDSFHLDRPPEARSLAQPESNLLKRRTHSKRQNSRKKATIE
jgi:hypothetical protein